MLVILGLSRQKAPPINKPIDKHPQKSPLQNPQRRRPRNARLRKSLVNPGISIFIVFFSLCDNILHGQGIELHPIHKSQKGKRIEAFVWRYF